MDLELRGIEFLIDYGIRGDDKSKWGKAVRWSGEMANIVSEAFREVSPDGRRWIYSHSAGGDATYESVENAGAKMFEDINILNGRTGAEELQEALKDNNYSSHEVKIFTCDKDHFAKPEWWWFMDGNISNKDAAKKRAFKGVWTHLHVIDVIVDGVPEAPEHSKLRDNYLSLANLKVYTSIYQGQPYSDSFVELMQIDWSTW